MASSVKKTKKQKGQKGNRISVSVYLLPEDHAVVKRAAQKQHRSIAQYIELLVVPQAKQDLEAQ